MSNTVKNIIMLIVFIISIALVIVGQRHIGVPGLVKELVGLAGLLSILYVYNRRYK